MSAPKTSAKRREISRGWTDNLGLKSFALAASIVLFSLVHSEEDAQRTVFMDVVALLPPPGAEKMLISELPDQVKVTLRGSRSQINAIQRHELPPVQVDLSDTGLSYFYFESAAIEVPGTVSIVKIQPAAIKLTWAVAGERRVPVNAHLTGAPEVGFAVQGPVKVIPPEVTLRGPQDQLASISEVHTDLVVLDGLALGTHERRVPLEPLPDHVSYIEDVAVTVQIEVAPELAERTLRRLEVAAVGEGNVVLRPPRVAVTLRGPAHLLPDLDPETLVPYVEVGEITPKDGAQPRKVQLRTVLQGLELVEVVPREVLVRAR